MPEILQTLEKDALELLQKLVQTPSFSKEEGKTADILFETASAWGLNPQRQGNNVWAIAPNFDAEKPSVWLNSHHDTVKPASSYSRDPFDGKMENGRLFGLGSNDAGGALVAMLAAFRALAQKERPFNLVYLASAEEEISGTGGISLDPFSSSASGINLCVSLFKIIIGISAKMAY
jgi:acetylornithine deacetylase